MIAASVEFARAWIGRFFAVQAFDRAMALAAQAFSALIPLIIGYSAVVPRARGKNFAHEPRPPPPGEGSARMMLAMLGEGAFR
jgi:hypothetical protein